MLAGVVATLTIAFMPLLVVAFTPVSTGYNADFFSVLEPGRVVIDTGSDEPVSFNVSSGIITARDNQINLFVDI